MGEHDRHGHEFCRFIRRVSEHQALVTRPPRIDPHRDVRGLLVDGREHGAGAVVEAPGRVRVSDVLDDPPDDVRDLHIRIGRDFARDERDAGGEDRFTGHLTALLLCDDRVQDPIGNLIGDFIRVPFGDGLGGK